jgi:hypothetical protein
MSILKRLFDFPPPQRSGSQTATNQPSTKEIAADPVLFANFLNHQLILHFPFEEDLSLAPDEQQCRRLNISERERSLCANEYVLLRALAACMFVQKNLQNLHERYYLSFKEALLPPVLDRMRSHAPDGHQDNPAEALEMYLETLESDSEFPFSLAYLNRVYPDTPNGEALLRHGIPIRLGFSHAIEVFKTVQNIFSLLATGVEYKTLENLHSLIEKYISK